jgi:hypothetical protein
MRYELRGTLGGLVVAALILGVIVTMEPTSRLVHIPVATLPVAQPQVKYLLTGIEHVRAVRLPPPRPRIPSQSREQE